MLRRCTPKQMRAALNEERVETCMQAKYRMERAMDQDRCFWIRVYCASIRPDHYLAIADIACA
jgi:hypothetical protein